MRKAKDLFTPNQNGLKIQTDENSEKESGAIKRCAKARAGAGTLEAFRRLAGVD